MTLQWNRSDAPADRRHALVAIVLITLCLHLLPGYARAQTSAIPLTTLPTAPTSGTLPNGVNFSVNVGAQHPTQGYIFYPGQGLQIWTFDQPVSLRFGLRGLNFSSECFIVPVGAVAEFIHPQHSWNPVNRGLCRTAAATETAESIFTLAGPVTQLALQAYTAASGGRGPGLIEVTVDVGIALDKSATAPDPLIAGSIVNYSFLVTNTGDVTLSDVTVADPLPGLSPISCPATTLAGGASMTCTATYQVTPADAAAGTISNTATATGNPATGTGPVSAQDSVTLSTTPMPAIALEKNASGPDPLIAGATANYEFIVTNTGNVPLTNVTVTDPLPGLSAITCPATTLNPDARMTCTASYVITPADVTAGVINNTATAEGTPPIGPSVSTQDSASLPPAQLPSIRIEKSGSGPNPLSAGATVNYEFLVLNTGNVPLTNVTVTDPLPGLSPVVCPGTVLNAGASMTCTASYQVTAADVVAGTINNTATVQGTPPSGPPVSAQDSASVPPLQSPAIALAKSASGPNPLTVGTPVTYRFLVTNTGDVPLTNVAVSDPLPGLSPVICPDAELDAGATMTCSATYTITAADVAAGFIDNTATVQGTPPSGPAVSAQDSTRLPPDQPNIETSKSSDRGNAEVGAGDTIAYTLRATITGGALGRALTLTDTLGAGLRFDSVTSPGTYSADTTGAPTLIFTLPAGTPAGSYSVSYTATVDASAIDAVSNTVVPSVGICSSCTTSNPLRAEPEIRLLKSAAVRRVRLGDLVRYTLVVSNVGSSDLVNGSIVDTPAPGFSFVDGSLQIADADNDARVESHNPLRFSGVDVPLGASATIDYLMRVGAGVRPGVHVNNAQVLSSRTGQPISAVASAQVEIVADPLTDESLIFGTVFDDRDRDGWQDSAVLSDVHIQGGFASDVYVPHSTTVDRGSGHDTVRDASAPLLHGLQLGTIAARQSEADPPHVVVIRQRLLEPTFTNDFVLTNAQGVTVRMDAMGRTLIERHGEAAKGLNAAAPRVERRVAHDQQGYVVDYIVSNDGIDERGIPGVRIASVDGLLMETDQFGRFHLVGVGGGPAERGRNFILKVDPATLPPGAELTTDNPRVRRITPGLPVRFDWGVALPTQRLQRADTIELELGEVIFAPGSAVVRDRYKPVLERMAAKIHEHGGGEIVIQANAGIEALAFARAVAVKDGLLGLLDDAVGDNVTISVRGKVEDPDSLFASIGAGGTRLGTVLFDTDRSAIRPEFEPLLDRIAATLEAADGGTILIVGHTDVRASYEYNTALGLRRAKSVYEALAKRLSAEVRAKVRVESNADPAAPIDATSQEGSR